MRPNKQEKINLNDASTEILLSLVDDSRLLAEIGGSKEATVETNDIMASIFHLSGLYTTVEKTNEEEEEDESQSEYYASLEQYVLRRKLYMIRKNPSLFLRMRDRLADSQICYSRHRQALELHNFIASLRIVDARKEIESHYLVIDDIGVLTMTTNNNDDTSVGSGDNDSLDKPLRTSVNIRRANTETLLSLAEDDMLATPPPPPPPLSSSDSGSYSFFSFAGFYPMGKQKRNSSPGSHAFLVQTKLMVIQENPAMFQRLRERLAEDHNRSSRYRQAVEIHKFLNEMKIVEARQEIKSHSLVIEDKKTMRFFHSSPPRREKNIRRLSPMSTSDDSTVVTVGSCESCDSPTPASPTPGLTLAQ